MRPWCGGCPLVRISRDSRAPVASPCRSQRAAFRRPAREGAPMLHAIDPTVSPSVLAAFADRDPSAVRALYREYGRLVYATAQRVLGRQDLAEDVVQQTFLRAWQAADRI